MLITTGLGFALFRAVDATVVMRRPPPAVAWARVVTPPPVVPPAPPLPFPQLRPVSPPPPSLPRLELSPSPVRTAARAFPKPGPSRPAPPQPIWRPDPPAPATNAAAAPAAPGDPRARDTLEGRIRAAVQAALRYPESAHDMGMEGRVLVGFDYRDREVSSIRLLRSSGNALLDGAALRTVRDAVYPAPGRLSGQTLALAVWVDFRIGGGGD